METVHAVTASVALAEESAEAAHSDSRSRLVAAADHGSWRWRRGSLTKTLISVSLRGRLIILGVGDSSGVSGVGRKDSGGSQRY